MSLNAIVVDDFYEDPDQVRAYALSRKYYEPYGVSSRPSEVPDWARMWKTSEYLSSAKCPFKSSEALIRRLEAIVGETIDRSYWNSDYPVDTIDWAPVYAKSSKVFTRGTAAEGKSAWWNCCFHLKLRKNEQGTFVHTHSLDKGNGTGPYGWAGVLYLNPTPPPNTGLYVWRSVDGTNNVIGDHMAPDPSRWELVDSYANVYNRLVIHRGNVPHSGGPGWDAPMDKARLFQTFFFKTESVDHREKLRVEL